MRPLAVIAALLVLCLVSACSDPTSGPVRIVWGRHACDQCGMAISEPQFAAELRLGPRDVMRFDDFGCAVLWLEAHGGPDQVQELWVMDQTSEQWLDARLAFYRAQQRTPMAHGFAAVGAAGPDTLDFEAARRTILAHQRKRAADAR